MWHKVALAQTYLLREEDENKPNPFFGSNIGFLEKLET